MRDDDLGYLLRRSNDERRMATESQDPSVRNVHDQMARGYATRVAKILAESEPTLP